MSRPVIFLFDDLRDARGLGQDVEEVGDRGDDLAVLLADLVLLEAGQAMQPQIEDGLRLLRDLSRRLCGQGMRRILAPIPAGEPHRMALLQRAGFRLAHVERELGLWESAAELYQATAPLADRIGQLDIEVGALAGAAAACKYPAVLFVVLPLGAAVLMWSGWEERASDEAAYRNIDSKGVMHFPGFSREAAEFLVNGRAARGIGVDTLSLDYGPSTDFAAHCAVLSANRWGIENLANLGRLPPRGATLFVGLPRVKGASGGPARILAVW